jgi:hypothetical protein
MKGIINKREVLYKKANRTPPHERQKLPLLVLAVKNIRRTYPKRYA